jgi:hypothetical protein
MHLHLRLVLFTATAENEHRILSSCHFASSVIFTLASRRQNKKTKTKNTHVVLALCNLNEAGLDQLYYLLRLECKLTPWSIIWGPPPPPPKQS